MFQQEHRGNSLLENNIPGEINIVNFDLVAAPARHKTTLKTTQF